MKDLARPLVGPLATLVALTLGCGQGAVALHVVPRPGQQQDFYALPFPSDLRLDAAGAFDLSSYPRLGGELTTYTDAMDSEIFGAGPSSAVIFRFGAPLDPSTLPADGPASLQPGASAFIVDITAGSPTYGQFSPVKATFTSDSGNFIGANWLSLRPYPGFPLRENTTYAALVTEDTLAADGGPVYRDSDLATLLMVSPPAASDTVMSAAWQRYAPLRAYLADHPPNNPVAGATVFTTQDATAIMLRLRRAVYQQAEAPQAADFQFVENLDGLCDIYQGTYQSPNFQQGQVPYLSQGGEIAFDASGAPIISRTETLRFAVSVPNGPMPKNGWPVMLYAHGTGGDYESFIDDGTALRAAYIEMDGQPDSRLAVISIDQVLHGTRDPTHSDPDLTFFNLENIKAARDNPKQGAADDFQLLRLVQGFYVPQAPVTGRPIWFDLSKIYFFGHSQGGLTGPLFLSAEPEVHAAVLSGAGALLVLSLLNKTQPVDIAELVQSILRETPTPDHPFLNLLQAYFESADPINYGRRMFREPPPGESPKSIFQTLGVVDHYAPIPNIEAFALSMGVQPVLPALVPIDGLPLAPLGWTTAPVRGNVADGRATAVLHQYPQLGNDDGHFVIFDDWDARHDWTHFVAADINTGIGQLP